MRTLYATFASLANSEVTSRLSFLESEGKVWVCAKDQGVGGYITERYGDKLNRAWIRAFAEASHAKVVKW